MSALARLQERPDAVRAAADLLKRLSHPVRLMLVCRLIEGEATVAQLESELGLRQPALSQQLADLRNANLIESRREARGVTYRLCEGPAETIVAAVHDCFCAAGPPVRQAQAAARQPAARAMPLGAAVFARIGPSAASDPDRSKP